MKVRMLVSVASLYGSPAAGNELELPPEVAEDWARAGYCEIIEQDKPDKQPKPRQRSKRDVRDAE